MVAFNDFLKLLDSQLSGSWWFPALLIGTGIFFYNLPRFSTISFLWARMENRYWKAWG